MQYHHNILLLRHPTAVRRENEDSSASTAATNTGAKFDEHNQETEDDFPWHYN